MITICNPQLDMHKTRGEFTVASCVYLWVCEVVLGS